MEKSEFFELRLDFVRRFGLPLLDLEGGIAKSHRTLSKQCPILFFAVTSHLDIDFKKLTAIIVASSVLDTKSEKPREYPDEKP